MCIPGTFTHTPDTLAAEHAVSLDCLLACAPPTYFSLLPRDVWLLVVSALHEGRVDKARRLKQDWTFPEAPKKVP